MTSIILPTTPHPASFSISLIQVTRNVQGPGGGFIQRIHLKGAHYRASVRLPIMSYAESLDWTGLRMSNVMVVCPVQQPGFDVGAPGLALVNGEGQAGANILLRGMTPHYVIQRGQYLNHIAIDGRRRLYCAREQRVVGADGTVALPLETMLTMLPADGDTIDLVTPAIEGLVSIAEDAWSIDTARHVGLEFIVEEAA